MAAGLVFAAAFFSYLNNLGNGFVYDDRYIVERNRAVQECDWKALARGSYWQELVSAGLYRPLTLLSLGANRVLGGPAAWSFHLVNNLLHALASVLVLGVGIRLGASGFAALAAALLFAVHPAHSEAVDAIVGRAEILALVFVLSALLLHAATRAVAPGFCFLLALLSKESAAFALPVFVLYDALLARNVRWKRYGSLAGSLMVYLLIRWQVFAGLGIGSREIGVLDNPLAHAPGSTRLLTAPILFGKYLLLMIAPVKLSADYSFDQIPLPGSLLDVRVLASVAAGIGLVLAYRHALQRGQGLLAFSLGATVLPLTGLLHLAFPLGTLFAERLAYLPSFGVALAAGLGLEALGRRSHRLALVLLAVIAGLGLFRTLLRNRDWVNNETLFRRTVEASPLSARSHFLLGTALFEKQDFAGAVEVFSQGLAIAPGHQEGRESLAESCRALAATLYNAGRLEEALPVLQRAVEIDAQVTDMNQIGILLGALGQLDEASGWHRRALERDSRNALALNYLGVIEERRGRKEQAGSLYLQALTASPDLVPALLNAGSLLMSDGDLPGAERHFQRAAELAPQSYETFNSLGIVLARQGRAEEAADAFRHAIDIDPALSAARDNLRALERK